jgi:hypothetical protein
MELETRKPIPAPEGYNHEGYQAEYAKARAEHTASMLIKTSKPRKKKVRPAEVEALKHRVESIEGSEVPEIAFNGAEMGLGSEKAGKEYSSKAEDNFAMDTAAIPPAGFNGA